MKRTFYKLLLGTLAVVLGLASVLGISGPKARPVTTCDDGPGIPIPIPPGSNNNIITTCDDGPGIPIPIPPGANNSIIIV
ncbi:MAG TPA: hypothetical protein GXX30_06440 [Firmicutes bacterium]|nr:hypothetical protein [Candidatus Fermentithermobacillaceae bacterium]